MYLKLEYFLFKINTITLQPFFNYVTVNRRKLFLVFLICPIFTRTHSTNHSKSNFTNQKTRLKTINQPTIHSSINQPTNHQSINQSINQPTNQSNQPVSIIGIDIESTLAPNIVQIIVRIHQIHFNFFFNSENFK